MSFSDIHFTNDQVDIEQLPAVEHLSYQHLHKDYLTVEMIATAIIMSIISIAMLSFLGFNDLSIPTFVPWLMIAVLISFVSFVFYVTWRGYKNKQYALRHLDIHYKEGIWWRSNTVIPYNRIQHVEVQQGPIERMFDLSKIKIYTAGGSSSDLSIGGIQIDEAHRIKQYIINKTGLDEEE